MYSIIRSEMQGIRGLCDQARLLLAIRHMGTFPEDKFQILLMQWT